MNENLEGIEKLQDDDGHWYWIPVDLVDDFNITLEEINKESVYTDLYYDLQDKFLKKYSQYRTGGDPDLPPDIFSKMKIQFCPICKGELVKLKELAQGVKECKDCTSRFFIIITSTGNKKN